MLIALVAVYGLEIHQMNVKTVFLNGAGGRDLHGTTRGFCGSDKEKKVCELIKSLYGLKQVPKQWHKQFDQTMLVNGFKNDEGDKCVYIKITRSLFVCILVICSSSVETLMT